MADATGSVAQQKTRTGIAGLDDVLNGGLSSNHLYLIEGAPGAGKTTLAFQYLIEGAATGDRVLLVTLSESEREIRQIAASHDWNLDNVPIVELLASEESLRPDSQYTMFHPSEVELGETIKTVLAEVERHQPTRMVFDSLAELRLLAQNPLRYRRQILALKQFFAGRACTVLMLDDVGSDAPDHDLRSVVHGVITLEQLSPEYGAERRRLRVLKMRGATYRGGYHDFRIRHGGLEVYPRLVAAEHHQPFKVQTLSSGVKPLDALVGGGLERGTSTLLMGPAGSGKSSVATQFVLAAAQRGEGAALFLFDESVQLMLNRSKNLNMDLQPYVDSGLVTIQQIDPAELSPGEFGHIVRHAAEGSNGHSARVVAIDSLNGYINAMPEERFLTIQLHELLMFLNQQGVITLMVVAQHGLIGAGIQAPVDASYLADGVILFRYFESEGLVRKAVSVVKKRSSNHEPSIRELRLSSKGISVSEPLANIHGVLGGNAMTGQSNLMVQSKDGA